MLNKIDYEAIKDIPLLGVGQTWQNVFSSRAANVTYTNSTGKPIFVSVMTYHIAQAGTILLVDGVRVSVESASIGGPVNSNLRAALCAVVPHGSTYRVELLFGFPIATIENWAELR